ncbi:MAG: response regulator transcription factor [Chloroflexaceae bacterium]|nr:response regulator transcription factor [Chloroflexaceae bacterium]
MNLLSKRFPNAQIHTMMAATLVVQQVATLQPDLVILDLSLPVTEQETPLAQAYVDTGIQLLQVLMREFTHLNIVVQSSYVKALVRVKYDIDNHAGGFTVVDKGLASEEMLTRVEWALQGITHTKDISGVQKGLEVKPEWVTVLMLAFKEGLQDKAIAQRLNVAERTVRHYWTKIYDVLGIYPEDDKRSGKNIRILTEIRAREEGLID